MLFHGIISSYTAHWFENAGNVLSYIMLLFYGLLLLISIYIYKFETIYRNRTIQRNNNSKNKQFKTSIFPFKSQMSKSYIFVLCFTMPAIICIFVGLTPTTYTFRTFSMQSLVFDFTHTLTFCYPFSTPGPSGRFTDQAGPHASDRRVFILRHYHQPTIINVELRRAGASRRK